MNAPSKENLNSFVERHFKNNFLTFCRLLAKYSASLEFAYVHEMDRSLAVRTTRIAIWGCGHGELDRVYEAVAALNASAPDGRAIELVICCGDFQSVRNEADLATMACPQKYRRMNTFFKYYSGEAIAPLPTIFVGGNHEASCYLQELYNGGWVAPNIFFLGRSGVIQFRGLRIAGVSGIFKGGDFRSGYFERLPYSDDAVRSINHVREFDYARLSTLRCPIDIMVGHDWPRGIEHYGDTSSLLRDKPLFEPDVRSGQLGNPASWELLTRIRPRFWFGAHLHVKFSALVIHPDRASVASGSVGASPTAGSAAACTIDNSSCHTLPEVTRFLSLDKCLPGRAYLQVLDVPWRAGESSLSRSPTYCMLHFD